MAEAVAKGNMFVWEGKDKTGKSVKGEMSSTSDALVKAILRRQGISPGKVKKKPRSEWDLGACARIEKYILEWLKKYSEGVLQKTIVEALDVNKANVSHVIKRLVTKEPQKYERYIDTDSVNNLSGIRYVEKES